MEIDRRARGVSNDPFVAPFIAARHAGGDEKRGRSLGGGGVDPGMTIAGDRRP